MIGNEWEPDQEIINRFTETLSDYIKGGKNEDETVKALSSICDNYAQKDLSSVLIGLCLTLEREEEETLGVSALSLIKKSLDQHFLKDSVEALMLLEHVLDYFPRDHWAFYALSDYEEALFDRVFPECVQEVRVPFHLRWDGRSRVVRPFKALKTVSLYCSVELN